MEFQVFHFDVCLSIFFRGLEREELRNLRPISSMMVVISVVEGIRDALSGALSSSAEWSRYFRHGAGLLLNRSPINYHVTLVFRASRVLRKPKLNPNPSL